ncbi:hypothetical protein PYCC9005_004846 [Savitreella phatthalungensis]
MLFLLPVASALSLATSSPGQQACTDLASSLGANKVVTSSLNPNYVYSHYHYWNYRVGRQQDPDCIVYPENAQDVSVALKAIKARGSHFAIKAGGHNGNRGFSSCPDGGPLIHLINMRKMSYDPTTDLATYEPGPTYGEIYNYFVQYNRTVVGGRLAGVGTGLGLGGGLSYLSGQYGLAVDNFRQLEVVLPSGEIVTTNKDTLPDLFFAMRGGGGNAFGVVTKYTVQARPVGTFNAGNIIYATGGPSERANQAVHDFMLYNTDPKAAIIGTWEKVPVPDLATHLNEAYILFLVYDGPDPGHAYDSFTAIPHLLDTRRQLTYPEAANIVPFATDLSAADNIFRVSAHHVTDSSYITAPQAWRQWSEDNAGKWSLLSMDFQPIPKSLTDASRAQGGNAINSPDGPYYWLNYILATPPTLSDADYNAVQASFKQLVESSTRAPDLPLFLNDASRDQDPLATFNTYAQLQAIKAKYDPDNFFKKYTGGWF